MRIVDSWIWHVSVSIGRGWMWVLWHEIRASSSLGISRRRAGSRLRLRGMLSLLWVMWENTVWNGRGCRWCMMSNMLVCWLILELRRHHLWFD
jgi:hypothetical protein